jgi:hypothetical protein
MAGAGRSQEPSENTGDYLKGTIEKLVNFYENKLKCSSNVCTNMYTLSQDQRLAGTSLARPSSA